MINLINDDSLNILKKMKDCSIDSIICDPPYGIGINGEKWDNSLPSHKIWNECYRVLKPGGFICSLSSARLYHRLAISMEDNGFITHPMMAWAYSSGMPKGMCLARSIDQYQSKLIPDEDFREYLRCKMRKKGLKAARIERDLGIKGMFSHYLGKSQPQYPSFEIWNKLKVILDLDNRYDFAIKERIKSKRETTHLGTYLKGLQKEYPKYSPKSSESSKWIGYRYGLQTLKPAIEPIYVGQKPFEKSIPSNILKFGTGAINVESNHRYPSNLIVEDSTSMKVHLNGNTKYFENIRQESQILYYSKPRKDEFNTHPTVKPVDLMKYLIKLYTPKGGLVLDPFMGSGTTALASLLSGYKLIGIEQDPHYYEIAKRRLTLEKLAP